ncbi:MAG: hypothetical protein WKG06_22795 [Segetibacter sp.]
MKKIFSFFIAACIFLSFGFINPGINISPKVLDAFNEDFNNVKNIKWFTCENTFIVSFEQNNIHTRIDYDKNGHFLSSMRYYSENNLPFNILLKIKEKYKGKTIRIVTEVTDQDSILYSINVEDEENVYVIESNSGAFIHLVKKFKKQLSK